MICAGDGCLHVVDDDGTVLAEGVAARLEEIDPHLQGGEWVFHLVRYAGCEPAERVELFRLDQLHLRGFQVFTGLLESLVQSGHLEPETLAFERVEDRTQEQVSIECVLGKVVLRP